MMVAEAILGIDLGSTSSRAYIWCPSKKDQYYVDNKAWSRLTCTRYEKTDFSSKGYPFDDGHVYVGDTINPERRPTSLKFGFYVLANASDELVEQYPLVNPLLERRTDLEFRTRLIQGLEGLLSTIQVRVRQICRSKKLTITTIGLSIPAQWNLDFEDIYQELVSRIFKHPASEIYFHTETEALAHCLFKDHLDELQDEPDNRAHDALLFLDFGGHNMNGCLFKVIRGQDGTANFYRAGDSFGAGGGSEQWEFNIGIVCDNYYRRLENTEFSSRHRQDFLDRFDREKATLGPGNKSTVTLLTEKDGEPWKMVLEPDDVARCFEDALRAPLAVAADHIARLAEMEGQCSRVVVSGGTSKNEILRSRLEKLCADASLPKPFFTDKLDVYYETAKIAKGVAYAAGNRRTIAEFFQGGAAFGLQRKQLCKNGNANPHHLWDDEAWFLMDEKRQKFVTVSATGSDEFKIVCDPFWSASETKTVDDILQYERCYDVLFLGKPRRGMLGFKLALTGTGDSTCLSVEGYRRAYKGRQGIKSRKYRLDDTSIIPLQFDRGTNCVCIGVRGKSLDELGLAKWGEPANVEDPMPPTPSPSLPQEPDDEENSITVDLGEYDLPSQFIDYDGMEFDTTDTSENVESPALQPLYSPISEPNGFKPSGPLQLRNFERVDFEVHAQGIQYRSLGKSSGSRPDSGKENLIPGTKNM